MEAERKKKNEHNRKESDHHRVPGDAAGKRRII